MNSSMPNIYIKNTIYRGNKKIQMKYEKRALYYSLGRPSYPSEAIEYIFKDAPTDVVTADIGAGTGKLTLMISEKSRQVYAVEPDDQMRAILLSEADNKDNIIVIDGHAEDTHIPDNSVDIICAAQAFHWFDTDLFRQEVNRILKKDGKVFILHNVFPEILESVLPNPRETTEDMLAQQKHREIQRQTFWDSNYTAMTFDNFVLYDKEQFLDYFLSFSTTPVCDDTNVDEYNAIIETVCSSFDKMSTDGKIMLPFITKLYTGDIKK